MSASHPPGSSAPAPAGDGDNRTVDLLRKIEKGVVDPSGIAPSDRRQLVGFLMGDGYSTAEMAQILQVGDRTIERAKKAVREANAIGRDPKLVEQMVGRLVGEAELCVQRIRKAVRDKKVSPAVKVDAEHHCFEIVRDLIHSLQLLGYLPTAAQKVEADLTHHVGDLPDFNSMQAEVHRLKEIAQQDGKSDSGAGNQLAQLEREIVQADLATKVASVSSQIIDVQGGSNDQE